MRVFTTSGGYDGDLATNGGETDGLAGGDAICELHATAAGLGGTWRAWLSTGDVDAIDRIDDVGPWYLVDRCTLVANSLSSLVVNGPLVNVGVDENGDSTSGNMWTGTEANGRSGSFDCGDWTSSFAGEGVVGIGSDSMMDGAWTHVSSNPCNLENYLICFEQ